ncbi:unnamed protein product [Ectocarpus sp. CCAP 1310/34]|nr:unnamed protein product [Ectocarpus sp. CCAP 1310/34]
MLLGSPLAHLSLFASKGTDFYMTSFNAQALIDEWNNGMNLVDILKILLPQAWGPLVGNPTNTYCLDTSDRKHLIAAERLAMINHAEKGHGISGATGRHDTSQRGYWNIFRNETFNGLPFAGRGMEGRWFVNNPFKGKVRLDYVSTTRPFPGTRPLSDRRFSQARKIAILAFHAEYQVSSKSERRRAWAIVELGYPLVPDEDVEIGPRGSVLSGESKGNEGGDKAGSTPGDELPPDPKREDPPNEEVDGDGGNQKQNELHDDLGDVDGAGTRIRNEPPDLTESKPSFGDKQKPLYHMPLKWRKVIGKPQVLHHWLTAKQVGLGIATTCMSLSTVFTSILDEYGDSFAALQILFDKRVSRSGPMAPAESDEFLWRIGPLNVYNPKKPDRTYDLDLAHRDDREVCKYRPALRGVAHSHYYVFPGRTDANTKQVLARLAVGEPGENWVNEEYSWSYAQR